MVPLKGCIGLKVEGLGFRREGFRAPLQGSFKGSFNKGSIRVPLKGFRI